MDNFTFALTALSIIAFMLMFIVIMHVVMGFKNFNISRTTKSVDTEKNVSGIESERYVNTGKPLPTTPEQVQQPPQLANLHRQLPQRPIQLGSPFKTPPASRARGCDGSSPLPILRETHPAYRRVRFNEPVISPPSIARQFDRPSPQEIRLSPPSQEYGNVAIALSHEPTVTGRLTSIDYTSARSSPYPGHIDFNDESHGNHNADQHPTSPIGEEQQRTFCLRLGTVLISIQVKLNFFRLGFLKATWCKVFGCHCCDLTSDTRLSNVFNIFLRATTLYLIYCRLCSALSDAFTSLLTTCGARVRCSHASAMIRQV